MTAPRPTMTALVLDEFGERLQLRTVDRPTPRHGQVLVRVEASGVNPLDTKIRAGAAAHAKVTVPAVLGMDLAGVVVDIGPGKSRWSVGDEVYGLTGGIGGHQGSLAQYAAVDADLLAGKPPRLSMTAAAALPLSLITAWEGLVDRAGVRPGHTVLVHGGAGGVGHIAVQIAVASGATVFATGRPGSSDIISGFGAHPLSYETTTAEDYLALSPEGDGFDIIFDTVGGATLDQSFRCVRPYVGHVVSVLGWGTHDLAPLSFRGASYSGVFTLLPLLTGLGRAHHGDILAAAAPWIDAGRVVPLVSPQRYTMASIAQAHQAVESGGATGKVVVDITH